MTVTPTAALIATAISPIEPTMPAINTGTATKRQINPSGGDGMSAPEADGMTVLAPFRLLAAGGGRFAPQYEADVDAAVADLSTGLKIDDQGRRVASGDSTSVGLTALLIGVKP